jgi:antitoxin (DNA-binding transcriptional repressor) of toxin-antitoxin stability system
MHSSVSSYEAKTKLPALLRRVVENGETINITRRGIKIAEINPPMETRIMKQREAVDKMRRFWEKRRAKNPRPRKYISRAELHEGHKR